MQIEPQIKIAKKARELFNILYIKALIVVKGKAFFGRLKQQPCIPHKDLSLLVGHYLCISENSVDIVGMQ